MKRHEDTNSARLNQLAQHGKQLNLVVHVKIARWLIEHEQTWLLADGSCEHHALTLAVRELHEVFVAQVPYTGGLHGLAHLCEVSACWDPHAARMRVAPHLDNVGAG